MKRTLLAALAASTFAGCAGLPFGPAAETDSTPSQMTALMARAGTALERVFRSLSAPAGEDVEATFTTAGDEFHREHAKALAGDRGAMFRVAQMFRHGSNGVPRDEETMVAWLRQASDLEHGVASYQLYLYYLNRGMDRQAVYYERLALKQGYTPPPRLDPRRG